MLILYEKVIISTVPAAAQITLPSSYFVNNRPIVLDVVYKPATTALIQQAKAADCYFVQGGTMLLEQGIEQFQLWQGRIAPREEMTNAIFSGVDKVDSV